MSPPGSPRGSPACIWKPAGPSLLDTTLHPSTACLFQLKPTAREPRAPHGQWPRLGCPAGCLERAGLAFIPPPPCTCQTLSPLLAPPGSFSGPENRRRGL